MMVKTAVIGLVHLHRDNFRSALFSCFYGAKVELGRRED
jgi:hypothetical protein